MGANKPFRERCRGVIKISEVSLNRKIRFRDTFKFAESFANIFMLDPAVSLKPRNPNFANDYIESRRIRAICETVLAHESRP
jgi:hypothetical protein